MQNADDLRPQPAPVESRPATSATSGEIESPTNAQPPAPNAAGPEAQRDADRDRAIVVEKLVSAMRRLFDSTPADQQGALVVEMLGDSIPELRALAFSLVEAQLADAEPVSADVGVAIARLLASPDPKVRYPAARLLNRLAQPGLEGDILRALAAETDAATAAELLAAAARQPTPALVDPMLRWLRQEWPYREAAAQAGLALARSDLMDPPSRETAAGILRPIPPENLSAPAIRFYALVGNSDDRARLRSLLTSTDAAKRIAACEALGADAAFLDDVVLAARSDATLTDIAVKAIATHRASLEGLALLQTLPFATPEARRSATAQVTVGMELSTLIMASDEIMLRSPPFVEAILTHVADLPPTEDPEEQALRARALLRLAESMLFQSRPDRALAMTDRVVPFTDTLSESEAARLARARTVSVLWLDRLDDPSLEASDPNDWLDALVVLGAEPQGPDVADAFLVRFGGNLTPEQVARFRDIEARLLTGPRPMGRGQLTSDPPAGDESDEQSVDDKEASPSDAPRQSNRRSGRRIEPPPRLPR